MEKWSALMYTDGPIPKQEVLRPFVFLEQLSKNEILELIEDELPQTQALVLCHLPAELARKILPSLDLFQIVLDKISRMREVSPDIIREVERVLERKHATPKTKLGGAEFASKIRHILVDDPEFDRMVLENAKASAPDAKLSKEDVDFLLKNSTMKERPRDFFHDPDFENDPRKGGLTDEEIALLLAPPKEQPTFDEREGLTSEEVDALLEMGDAEPDSTEEPGYSR